MNPFILALQFFGFMGALAVFLLGLAVPFLWGQYSPETLERLGGWVYLIWPVTAYVGALGAATIVILIL